MSDIGRSRGNETEDASYPQRLRPSKGIEAATLQPRPPLPYHQSLRSL